MTHTNFTRINFHSTVYLPKAEVDAFLGADVRPSCDILGIPCVSESAYNAFLDSSPEFFERNLRQRLPLDLDKVIQTEISLFLFIGDLLDIRSGQPVHPALRMDVRSN